MNPVVLLTATILLFGELILLRSSNRYSRFSALQGTDAQQPQVSTALARLDRDLLEVDIYLKELDLEHTKSLAYGWREDVSNKLSEWKSSLQTAFEKLRATVRSFVSQLTTREGSALPEWVYTGFSGALEDVLRYIEKRMQLEDNGFRSALLEVLKNVVRIYRNRIQEAAQKVPGSNTSSTGPVPAPIPEPTGQPGNPSARAFWEL